MFICTCCGTALNAPYFYNGGVYGYTCIKKVNPYVCKNKPKMKCVEVEITNIYFEENCSRGIALLIIDGKKEQYTAYREYDSLTETFSESFEINNFYFHDGKLYTYIQNK